MKLLKFDCYGPYICNSVRWRRALGIRGQLWLNVMTVETLRGGDWWCGGCGLSIAVVIGGAVVMVCVVRWWRRAVVIVFVWIKGRRKK